MEDQLCLIEELRTRVQELESKVEALRISRRVLMNLVDSVEKEKKDQISRLSSRNERLQKNNCRYARTIMCRNIRITQLEEQLRRFAGSKIPTNNTCT